MVTGYAPGTAQRLRILLLAPQPFYQDRGTPIAVRHLLETLVAAGFEVDLLTYHEGADIVIPNCTIRRIPSLPGLTGIRPGFSAKKLLCDIMMLTMAVRLTTRLRPDLVHAVEESAFMALVLRRLSGPRTSTTWIRRWWSSYGTGFHGLAASRRSIAGSSGS